MLFNVLSLLKLIVILWGKMLQKVLGPSTLQFQAVPNLYVPSSLKIEKDTRMSGFLEITFPYFATKSC